MRKYFLLLISLFFMPLIASSPARSSDPIRVGVYQNTPLTFIEENGKVEGFFIDILEYIAGKEGWKIEYVHSSWPECLSNLESGNIDLLVGIAYSKSRGRIFDYTFESVITNWGQMYLNKESDVESIIDLKGKKVAVLQNDIYFNNLRKLVNQFGIKCRFIEAFEYEDVLELVEIGRCEAGLVSQIYGLQREGDYDIAKSSILFNPQKIYWATPKRKNQEILYKLDSYLRKLKNNQQSIYHELLAKWFDIGTKSKFERWFKWIISGFAVLLTLFFTASLILRAQVKSKTKELLSKNEALIKEIKYRKQAEEALQDSEELLKATLESTADGILAVDENGNVTHTNNRFAQIWHIPNELIETRDDEKLLNYVSNQLVDPEVFLSKVRELYNSANEDFDTIYFKDGRIIERYSCPLIRNAVIAGRVWSFRDITERMHLEKQLQQSHKMESIGTLAGGIAHDFNNIVGIILGNTELAMDDVPKWNPARLNLEEVMTASIRAKDVVRQLLSFARKTTLEKKPTNVSPIIIESLKLLRASIPTSIEIRQNIPKDIDTILADPTQINQVLINLCTNADYAMPEGGILEVSLKDVELDKDTAAQYPDLNPGRYVKLIVSDTGHGISQEEIDRIFDPYFTTKEVGKGTGMGLAVVHGIVIGHNGTIIVESEPGKGTIFSIFFPIVEKEPVVETETVEELPAGNERILFVDDEESMVYVGRNRLERLGYQVETRMNPVKALELFRANPDQFDLVITDMTMPQMTGDRLTKEILKIRTDMPVILCTGFSEKIDAEKAKEIGIRQYIEKPLNRRDLAKLVRKVLDEK